MIKSGNILPVAIAAVLLFGSWPSRGQILDRGLALSDMSPFMEKGTWMVGGTANWAVHDNDSYRFLIADDLTTTGYKLSISPTVCYMFKNNMGAGMRVVYNRSMLKVDEASIGVGDIGIDINDYHTLKHTFQLQGILRNYIPIEDSRRFALYNEIQLVCKLGASKVVNGIGETLEGSYGDIRSFGLNLCPGMMAFVNNHVAVDVNVSMLGLNFGRTEQSHNQVSGASTDKTLLNFNINILAIGFGLYYYW